MRVVFKDNYGFCVQYPYGCRPWIKLRNDSLFDSTISLDEHVITIWTLVHLYSVMELLEVTEIQMPYRFLITEWAEPGLLSITLSFLSGCHQWEQPCSSSCFTHQDVLFHYIPKPVQSNEYGLKLIFPL